MGCIALLHDLPRDRLLWPLQGPLSTTHCHARPPSKGLSQASHRPQVLPTTGTPRHVSLHPERTGTKLDSNRNDRKHRSLPYRPHAVLASRASDKTSVDALPAPRKRPALTELSTVATGSRSTRTDPEFVTRQLSTSLPPKLSHESSLHHELRSTTLLAAIRAQQLNSPRLPLHMREKTHLSKPRPSVTTPLLAALCAPSTTQSRTTRTLPKIPPNRYNTLGHRGRPNPLRPPLKP